MTSWWYGPRIRRVFRELRLLAAGSPRKTGRSGVKSWTYSIHLFPQAKKKPHRWRGIRYGIQSWREPPPLHHVPRKNIGSSLDSRHIASIGMPRSGSHPNAWSQINEIKIRTHEIHKHSSKQPRRVNSNWTLFWGVDGHQVSFDLNQNKPFPGPSDTIRCPSRKFNHPKCLLEWIYHRQASNKHSSWQVSNFPTQLVFKPSNPSIL